MPNPVEPDGGLQTLAYDQDSVWHKHTGKSRACATTSKAEKT